MSNLLDDFGKEVMENIRDNGIELVDAMMNGIMKDEENIEFHSVISSLPLQTQECLRKIIIASIDTAIFDFMNYFENSDNWKISNPEMKLKSIAEISDGLSGELFGDNGWIKKFSHYYDSTTDMS